ncbi:MAG: pentapeptide repeat-containing protein [Methanothrix sp.]|nr:pentapeptide repeat-containing protein [Methanothrix sp.]
MKAALGMSEEMILRICLMLSIILSALANGAVSDNVLPLSESFQLREISAQEVMANANSSLTIYDHVIIAGDLFLNIDQYTPIRITNSVFRDNVSCKGVTFYGDVNFENTIFQRNAIFNETKFMTAANFNGSRFLGEASFNMSRFTDGGNFDFTYFNGLADFAGVWFDKFATFYNATFMGEIQFPFSEFNGAYANFESAQCIGDVYFYGSQFNSYSTFADARLEKNADFHATKYSNGVGFFHAQFLGQADFARSHFIEDSIFSQAHFNDVASFLNAKFDGPVFFNDTVFGKDADFDNAQFQAPTDMSYIAFEGDLKMNSTKIAGMVFDGSTFSGGSRLYLAKADINRFIVSWSQIRDILSFDTAAYLSLIKNYKDLGQGNDANECYYEYRYLNQARKPIGFSKILDELAWLSCGYGVRPHYALLCGMVIILIFSIIYWLGRGVEGFHDIHGHQLMVASLFYSTIAFTANSKGLPLRGHYKYLGIAEGIVGWLLMALFLVTLGRLIIG